MRVRTTFMIAATLASLLPGQPRNSRAESKTLQVDGVARTYLLAKPAQRLPAIPIVFVFHGPGGSGERVARSVRMHNAPFARNALVVYPDGLEQLWNDGRNANGAARAQRDVAFIRALIDDLIKTDKALDRTRVFAVGVSNGGSFALRLACELSDRIAGVASVGGTLPVTLKSSCAPVDPVPMLLLQASTEEMAPTAGPVLNAADTFAHWSKINQCIADPVVQARPGAIPAKVTIARKCKDGAEVRWIGAEATSKGWQEESTREITEFLARFHRAPRF